MRPEDYRALMAELRVQNGLLMLLIGAVTREQHATGSFLITILGTITMLSAIPLAWGSPTPPQEDKHVPNESRRNRTS